MKGLLFSEQTFQQPTKKKSNNNQNLISEHWGRKDLHI